MSKQFYFKESSLAYVQFFVYTQLNVKTGLFQTIQSSISTQFKYQNSSIYNNPLQHKYSLFQTIQFNISTV